MSPATPCPQFRGEKWRCRAGAQRSLTSRRCFLLPSHPAGSHACGTGTELRVLSHRESTAEAARPQSHPAGPRTDLRAGQSHGATGALFSLKGKGERARVRLCSNSSPSPCTTGPSTPRAIASLCEPRAGDLQARPSKRLHPRGPGLSPSSLAASPSTSGCCPAGRSRHSHRLDRRPGPGAVGP